MCDESKYPGATDGVSEDYQPLDSTYVGIIVLYLILSIKRAWYVAGKYPTFKYLPHRNFDRFFFL